MLNLTKTSEISKLKPKTVLVTKKHVTYDTDQSQLSDMTLFLV